MVLDDGRQGIQHEARAPRQGTLTTVLPFSGCPRVSGQSSLKSFVLGTHE
jgi:hypothetical protein